MSRSQRKQNEAARAQRHRAQAAAKPAPLPPWLRPDLELAVNVDSDPADVFIEPGLDIPPKLRPHLRRVWAIAAKMGAPRDLEFIGLPDGTSTSVLVLLRAKAVESFEQELPELARELATPPAPGRGRVFLVDPRTGHFHIAGYRLAHLSPGGDA